MSGPALSPPPPEGGSPTPPPWASSPPAREPFRWGQFFGGVAITLASLVLGVLAMGALLQVAGTSLSPLSTVPIVVIALMVVGIVLATRPDRRALGIGMLVGLAASAVVLGGICAALFVSLGGGVGG